MKTAIFKSKDQDGNPVKYYVFRVKGVLHIQRRILTNKRIKKAGGYDLLMVFKNYYLYEQIMSITDSSFITILSIYRESLGIVLEN